MMGPTGQKCWKPLLTKTHRLLKLKQRKKVPEMAIKFKAALDILLPYLKKYRFRMVWIFLLVILVVSTDLVQPIIVKEAIDKHISVPHPDMGSITLMTGIYFIVVIAAFGLTYYQNILLQETGQSIIKHIRTDLFRHLQGLSLKYFDRNASGRIITNVVSDTEALNNFFTDFLANNIKSIFTLIMIIVFMFQLNIKIAAYCFLVVPLIIIISAYFQGKLRAINQEMRSRLSTVIAFLAENLAGMSIVQIFHQEKKQFREFDLRNTKLLESTMVENQLTLAYFLFTESLGDIGVAALVWFGSGPVIRGSVSFGVLYAFIGYIRRFFQPINSITMQLNVLQTMLVATERIVRTFNEKPDITEIAGAKVPAVKGGISFNATHLAYKEDNDILKGIDLEIKPGDRVGFVGASGAGKTSLMSLLARFYDPTGGSVKIDGVDIREWPLKELRQTVGIVQQDITLFAGTVLDNIRFFRKEIPATRVYEVSKMIGADDFIRRLPLGYETLLSEKGATLSFGERQLLSFARVMVFDPKILILDEATASLDSESEAVLQEAIGKVSGGRTLLVIAHRLSTVQQMDYIIVMDDGLIVEKGTHEELLKKSGHYTTLHKSGLLIEEALI
jgi:ATP-binding cassette subfamily B protein